LIKFVIPKQKYSGEDVNILLSKRQRTYEQARSKHPKRWTRKSRNWSPIEAVHLDPASSNSKTALAMAVNLLLLEVTSLLTNPEIIL
jgi:putative transposase